MPKPDDDYCAAQVREGDLDRYLAILYAPTAVRRALFALTALDLELAGIVRSTREQMLGEMRLVWWRDSLVALDSGRVPAQPILQALAFELLPRGVKGVSLEPLEDGFWRLLTEQLQEESSLRAYAAARGGTLFGAMLRLAEPAANRAATEAARRLGEAWALLELARLPPESFDLRAAIGVARSSLARADMRLLPRSAKVRPIRGLARLVHADLQRLEAGGPGAAHIRRGAPGRQLLLLRGALGG